MSRRALLIGGATVLAVGLGIAALPLWSRRLTPAGQASGELAMRGHSGFFKLTPKLCRKAATGVGAGTYDLATPALAFGYFNDQDGGEWVEAQGPGATGATRFDRADCSVFEATASIERGFTSGHVEVVCDSSNSPAVNHVEGEVTFHTCGEGGP
jgi:hypothetical protein